MQPLTAPQIQQRARTVEQRLRLGSVVGQQGHSTLYAFSDGYHVLRCRGPRGLSYFAILPSGEIKDLFHRTINDPEIRLVVQIVTVMSRPRLEQKIKAWARTVSTIRY